MVTKVLLTRELGHPLLQIGWKLLMEVEEETISCLEYPRLWSTCHFNLVQDIVILNLFLAYQLKLIRVLSLLFYILIMYTQYQYLFSLRVFLFQFHLNLSSSHIIKALLDLRFEKREYGSLLNRLIYQSVILIL